MNRIVCSRVITYSRSALAVRSLVPAIGSTTTATFRSHIQPASARYSTSQSEDYFDEIKARNDPTLPLDNFIRRHIGVDNKEIKQILEVVGANSIDEFIDRVIPKPVKTKKELKFKNDRLRGERDLLGELRNTAKKNKIYKSFIGCGYYDTVTPNVILRNVIENPLWYTPYTPYQSEISQGRMESLLNFQQMIEDLTGLPKANASLLDESNSAAEAMMVAVDHHKGKLNKFFVANDVHPHVIDVIVTRAGLRSIEIVIGDPYEQTFKENEYAGILLAYPGTDGKVRDHSELVSRCKQNGLVTVADCDLLALTILKSPGEMGFDIAVGSAQRFGVPLGNGGPHAAFMSCSDAFIRKIPGRIVGVSKDARGLPALRLAITTREQHIKRDKATSNICTAQALLANVSAMYALYHGPEGLKAIASRVNQLAQTFKIGVSKLGYEVGNGAIFDTIKIKVNNKDQYQEIARRAEAKKVNLRHFDEKSISVSFDETHTIEDINNLLNIFNVNNKEIINVNEEISKTKVDFGSLNRVTPFLTHPIFNSFRSEHEMLRYIYKLSSKDISLAQSMIPLGSCTMKLNATAEMIPITWPEFNNIHPFAPNNQKVGYESMINELKGMLTKITAFDDVTFQPNSGAQGELTGLALIRGYQKAQGQQHRNIAMLPNSAHGTNFASAKLAGLDVLTVECSTDGYINMKDFKEKLEKYGDRLSVFMVTYPSTYGIFEENIKSVIKKIHDTGAQVYLDGANMNALVGLVKPGELGADVCHINLHKTFCIPHGGGGPGMGPVCMKKHLVPYMPKHVSEDGIGFFHGPKGGVAGAPYSSASILAISYVYMKLMGGQGLKKSTETAILNANYMMKRLEGHYLTRFKTKAGYCAHEFIIDIRPFEKTAGLKVEDIAKRLMDYGFHAPTVSWPVPGTLMIEPTESESKEELDRFCDALINIRKEISEIENGLYSQEENVLKLSPFTHDMVIKDEWQYKFSRSKAAYPLPYLKSNKFWPSVGRIDNVYGDRNLVCSCPLPEEYEQPK